jgi:hypothetical protein
LRAEHELEGFRCRNRPAVDLSQDASSASRAPGSLRSASCARMRAYFGAI